MQNSMHQAQGTQHIATSAIRFLLGVAVALLLCFGLQAVCYYGLGWKTGKGESNYFSTMSRFQAAAHPAADIAFAGSSITGRLPGREVGNEKIANLGSDGGPALDGMRMLVAGKIALPRWLVMETNTMYGGVGFGESLISRNGQGPWFLIGSRCPLLGASARPSAMLYSQLLRRPAVLLAEPVSLVTNVPENANVNDMTDLEKLRLQQYLTAIADLRSKGVQIILVKIPAGAMNDRERHLVSCSIAQIQKDRTIFYLDVDAQIPRDKLVFTDGVHMAPESAAKVLTSIVNFCYQQ
jgi:hypothetical protein